MLKLEGDWVPGLLALTETAVVAADVHAVDVGHIAATDVSTKTGNEMHPMCCDYSGERDATSEESSAV